MAKVYPARRCLAEGGLTKPKCKMVLHPQIPPPTWKSGRGSKESKSQVGWGLSLNQIVLHKKQLEDPDIGPKLKCKESGQRSCGPEVCALSPTTRHLWNCWALLQIQDGMLMCHFVRCDAVGDHLEFIVPGPYIMKFYTMFMTCNWMDTLVKKPERKPSKGSTGVVLERIAIIGLLNVMNVSK